MHNALLLMPARLSSITRLIPALTAPVASHILRKSVAIGQHGAITSSFAVESENLMVPWLCFAQMLHMP
jgi:type III secretory pathway component EscT